MWGHWENENTRKLKTRRALSRLGVLVFIYNLLFTVLRTVISHYFYEIPTIDIYQIRRICNEKFQIPNSKFANSKFANSKFEVRQWVAAAMGAVGGMHVSIFGILCFSMTLCALKRCNAEYRYYLPASWQWIFSPHSNSKRSILENWKTENWKWYYIWHLNTYLYTVFTVIFTVNSHWLRIFLVIDMYRIVQKSSCGEIFLQSSQHRHCPKIRKYENTGA